MRAFTPPTHRDPVCPSQQVYSNNDWLYHYWKLEQDLFAAGKSWVSSIFSRGTYVSSSVEQAIWLVQMKIPISSELHQWQRSKQAQKMKCQTLPWYFWAINLLFLFDKEVFLAWMECNGEKRCVFGGPKRWELRFINIFWLIWP